MISRIDEAIISLEIANLNDQLNPEQKEILQKGKRAVIGEVREWSGKKYKKTSSGWEPVKGEGIDNKAKSEEKPVEKKKEDEKNFEILTPRASDLKVGDIAYDWEYYMMEENKLSDDAVSSGIITSVKPLINGFGEHIGSIVSFDNETPEEIRGNLVIKRVLKKESKNDKEEEYKKDVSEAKDSMYYLLKKFYKEKPAMSSDRRHIEVAKVIAKKYKIKYQDLLKQYTPSRNINGEKYWDKNGEIVS